MKTILRLAVLALAGTARAGIRRERAGDPEAERHADARRRSRSRSRRRRPIRSRAKISIYVPTGYTINASAAPGTKIGTTTGTVFARDANIPLPLVG